MKACPYCAEEIQDEAIVCRFCNRDIPAARVVSTPASVPPDPVALLASRRKSRQIAAGCVGGVLLLVAGSLISSFLIDRYNETHMTQEQKTARANAAALRESIKRDPTTPPTLSVTVGWSMSALQITNTGSPLGTTITAYINGTPPFTFRAEATLPPIGQSVQIPLMLFTTKSGERFNPMTHAVTVAWIGGGGFDYRSFSK